MSGWLQRRGLWMVTLVTAILDLSAIALDHRSHVFGNAIAREHSGWR